jgi:hypothetical protein
MVKKELCTQIKDGYNWIIKEIIVSIDDAIKLMQAKISDASGAFVVRVVKMSDEEARISVYAPAGDMQKIKDATFQTAIDLLNKEGMDVQVFVYDINITPPPA